MVEVKVLEVSRDGKIRLTRRELLPRAGRAAHMDIISPPRQPFDLTPHLAQGRADHALAADVDAIREGIDGADRHK